jgi:ribonuclease-3
VVDLAALEQVLGYTFRDVSLLSRAITHRSYEGLESGDPANERLEFLGDAVLSVVVAAALYEDGSLREGEMTKVRLAVVNEATLASVADGLGLSAALRLGKGEEASGGRRKASILADTLEAIIGAIFLDGGLEPAQAFVLSRWSELIAERSAAPGGRDYKTRLQEVLANRGEVPAYHVAGEGPDHARRFDATVTAGGSLLGIGSGTSKKRAEQEAARRALEHLGVEDA